MDVLDSEDISNEITVSVFHDKDNSNVRIQEDVNISVITFTIRKYQINIFKR